MRREVCDPEWQPPGPGRALARVLAGRGNNLHEVMVSGEIPSTPTRSSSPQIIYNKREVDALMTKRSDNDKTFNKADDTMPLMPDDNKINKTTSSNLKEETEVSEVNSKSLKSEAWAEKRILASMPRKFRRSVWVRRGDVVVVEWIPEGDRVKAEIVTVLLRNMVRTLRLSGELEWPPEFDHPDFGDVEKCRDESESGEEGDDFVPANTNRRPPLEVETSSSSTSSSSTTTSSSSSSEDSDSEEENEGAGSVFENPNRRTVSRSMSKSESSQSDVENIVRG